ncbi:MAG: hypothetical protein FWE71_02040 [Nocardioidaceae bacterium]|nr:hypothetical protein [Nocardioidaceae bacterium]MCL2613366.1 hypothetical protein [Nocardioidaceae bacterium]
MSDEEAFVRDLEALLLVLPEGAVFTHITAARLYRWQLPALPSQVPYFAAVRGERCPRRPGLLCSRLTHQSAETWVGHLPVDTPEEVLLRCARDLGVLDLLILIDSALRMGHVSEARMREILASARPGVARLRRAWDLSDPAAESAGETVLRALHLAIDVPVVSQVDVHDEGGQYVGRADLLVAGATRVHEYDGAGHRDKVQHRNDLRRERRFAGTPYDRYGFTLDDLLNHPAVILHEIDRGLGRRHSAGRLRRWRVLVGESLYSDRGRARLINRWKRAMGVVEWSETAS